MTSDNPNRMQHVPNLITAGRLLSVPIIVLLILSHHWTMAFWLFVLAGLSDAADGLVARLGRARSKLGSWLDPIADKLLLLGSYLAMTAVGLVPIWLLVLILLRDLVIIIGIGLLTLALKERLAIQPLWIGKLNTVLQLSLVGLVLAVKGPGLPFHDYLLIGIIIVALSTLASLGAYLMRGVFILRTRVAAEVAPRSDSEDGGPAA